MTMLIVCSVFDTAAEAYAPPVFMPHPNIARRSLQQEVNRADPQNQLYNNPQDFILYELGTFDDSTGRLTSHETPRIIVRAQDLKG